jgi:hypothetical protein
MYDCGPDGATFDPPAELRMSYDPAALPPGVSEQNLVIAYFDKAKNTWVELQTTVDPVTRTLVAKIAHFTSFTVLSKKTAATSTPTPVSTPVATPTSTTAATPTSTPDVITPPAAKPASFSMGTLSITPGETVSGGKVDISVLVSNTGGEAGKYTLTLKINSVVETTKEITLAAGASEKVVFSTNKESPGTYKVDINGATGSFEVKASSTSAPATPHAEEKPDTQPVNWAIIVVIIVLVVAIIFVSILLVRRRRK